MKNATVTSVINKLTNLTLVGENKKYYKKSNFNLPAILPIYVLVVLTCVLGNSLVCFTIYKNRQMRTNYFYLLANLAVADTSDLCACGTDLRAWQFVGVFHYLQKSANEDKLLLSPCKSCCCRYWICTDNTNTSYAVCQR